MSTREHAVAQTERLLRAAESTPDLNYAKLLVNVANGWTNLAFEEVAHHNSISLARG